MNHYGLFWQSGALDAVENDPSLPLVPLVVSDWAEGAVLVVCNDPDIARVEIEFPVFTYSGSDLLATAVQDQHTADCFLIRWDLEEAVWLYPEDSARPWLCRGWYSDLPVPPARELGGGLQHPRP